MTRSLFLLSLFLPFLVHGQRQAVNFQFKNWEVLEAFPGGSRDDASGFSLNGFGYFGCGIDGDYQLRKDWWLFNPHTRTWSQTTELPGLARQYATALTSASHAYLIGGEEDGSFSSDVFRYYPASGVWRDSYGPFQSRAAATGFSIGDHLFYGTGRDEFLGKFNDVWRFDTKQKSWTRIADLPVAGRDEMVGFSALGKGYMLLGRDSMGAVYSDVFCYDPFNDRWEAIGTYPGRARTYACAVAEPGGAVIAGGMDQDGQLLSEVYHFDAEAQAWQRLPDLPAGEVRGMEGFRIGNAIYFCGGLTHNYTRVDKVQQLSFDTEGAEPVITLWPVPASGVLNVYFESGWFEKLTTARVLDMCGREMLNERIDPGQELVTLAIPSLRPGMYCVVLEWHDGHVIKSFTVAE